jgi:hypothetical protein
MNWGGIHESTRDYWLESLAQGLPGFDQLGATATQVSYFRDWVTNIVVPPALILFSRDHQRGFREAAAQTADGIVNTRMLITPFGSLA